MARGPLVATTQFGFNWGPIIVERATSDERYGVWLHIRTGKQLLTVRATPSGLLRVGAIEKDWHRAGNVSK